MNKSPEYTHSLESAVECGRGTVTYQSNHVLSSQFRHLATLFRVSKGENTQKWLYHSLPLGDVLGLLCSWPKATQAGSSPRRPSGGIELPDRYFKH